MAGHTPGPWRFMTDTTGEYLAVFATPQGGTKVICPVKIADEANAHLIAAAPELLDALRALVQVYEKVGGPLAVDPKVADARAAIAKAEGRT